MSEADNVERAIRSAISIISDCAEDNWAGDGEKKITRGTWDRATKLLKDVQKEFNSKLSGKNFPECNILPCADGSLEIEWIHEDFEMYLNLSEKGEIDAYGENGEGETVVDDVSEEEKNTVSVTSEFLIKMAGKGK